VPDKIQTSPSEQLNLKLESASSVDKISHIIKFVDAETKAIREEAISRVVSSGIFEPPHLGRK
jgi:hypothetical protein